MGYFSHSIYFLQLHRIYAIVCFAFSSITSVRSSSIVFPFSEKCSFTTIFVFPLLPMQTGQVMAIKEDKSFTGTQIGYRSLLLEKGHGVSVSTARCLSKVLNCFIQLSKNTKEENRLSYISRWKRGET